MSDERARSDGGQPTAGAADAERGDDGSGDTGEGGGPPSECAIEPAQRVQETPPSGIRRFFELAEEADDVISLGVGEPDFAAPWAARTAAIDSLERGRTSYTANRGKRELREAIARHVTRYDLAYDPDDEIIVTTGVSEGLDVALRALINPGDTVAVAQPTYVSYVPGVRFAGGEPLPVPTRAADDFELTRESLEEAGADEADALLYCYPNNPTGATMSRDALEPVAAFAREHDLTVLADEVYAQLTYDGDHTSIATLPGMRERTVLFNGFSKAYAMTGMRLGYALGPAEAITAINRVHQYAMLSAPTTAQYAAIEALESCDDDVAEMAARYNRRRRLVLSRCEDLGLDCFEPGGAFYAFPEAPVRTADGRGWRPPEDDETGDDEAFAEALLQEEGVAAVPGRVFGAGGEGHLRVSYATGLDDLREAFDRMGRVVN
jgi:aminotransferase